MNVDRQTRAILAKLWDSFEESGRGSRTRTLRHLGVSNSYLRDWKRGKGRIDLVVLLKILDFLQIDPVVFFSEALQEDESASEIKALHTEALKLPGEDPPEVSIALRRWQGERDGL